MEKKVLNMKVIICYVLIAAMLFQNLCSGAPIIFARPLDGNDTASVEITTENPEKAGEEDGDYFADEEAAGNSVDDETQQGSGDEKFDNEDAVREGENDDESDSKYDGLLAGNGLTAGELAEYNNQMFSIGLFGISIPNENLRPIVGLAFGTYEDSLFTSPVGNEVTSGDSIAIRVSFDYKTYGEFIPEEYIKAKITMPDGITVFAPDLSSSNQFKMLSEDLSGTGEIVISNLIRGKQYTAEDTLYLSGIVNEDIDEIKEIIIEFEHINADMEEDGLPPITSSQTILVKPAMKVEALKEADKTLVVTGNEDRSDVTYTIGLKNNGYLKPQEIVLEDTLPVGAVLLSNDVKVPFKAEYYDENGDLLVGVYDLADVRKIIWTIDDTSAYDFIDFKVSGTDSTEVSKTKVQFADSIGTTELQTRTNTLDYAFKYTQGAYDPIESNAVVTSDIELRDPKFEWALRKYNISPEVSIGEETEFEIYVHNKADVYPDENPVLTDILPDGMVYVSFTAESGFAGTAANETAGTLTLTLNKTELENVGVNQEACIGTVKVKLNPQTGSDKFTAQKYYNTISSHFENNGMKIKPVSP